MEIFDTELKLKHLRKAARYFDSSSFLYQETAKRLTENFDSNIRKSFKNALVLGDKNGILSGSLQKCLTIDAVTETYLVSDFADKNSKLHRKKQQIINFEILPFQKNEFDLIVSNLALHWVNDFVGLLVQIKSCLQKGGYFSANLLGGETLTELRQSIFIAEGEFGGNSMRVSPMMWVKDGASLLQRVGFKEPVSSSEKITVKYPDLKTLLFDLKNMGEQNALVAANKKTPPKKLWTRAEQIYRENFSDENGDLAANFEVINLSGWV